MAAGVVVAVVVGVCGSAEPEQRGAQAGPPPGVTAVSAPSWDDLPDGFLIGHRGAAALAPENTIAAFERAADLGVPIETDVRVLADSGLVLLHDPTVDRTTTASGPVTALTLDSYDHLVCDASAWGQTGWADTGLPTLGDLLDRFGNRELLLLETKDPAATAPLLDALDAYGIDRRSVVVQSFHAPDLALATARGWETALLGGVDPVTAAAQGIDWLGPEQSSVSSALVDATHAAGIRLTTWTVNDRAAVEALLALGVDAVITDDPRPLPSASRR